MNTLPLCNSIVNGKVLFDDLLVTSYSKDSHQTCSALERRIATETEDLIESECDTFFLFILKSAFAFVLTGDNVRGRGGDI